MNLIPLLPRGLFIIQAQPLIFLQDIDGVEGRSWEGQLQMGPISKDCWESKPQPWMKWTTRVPGKREGETPLWAANRNLDLLLFHNLSLFSHFSIQNYFSFDISFCCIQSTGLKSGTWQWTREMTSLTSLSSTLVDGEGQGTADVKGRWPWNTWNSMKGINSMTLWQRTTWQDKKLDRAGISAETWGQPCEEHIPGTQQKSYVRSLLKGMKRSSR